MPSPNPSSGSDPGLLSRVWGMVWEKLNSLPFVVVVLLVIVFFSITGTVISQEPLLQQSTGDVTLVDTEILGLIPYEVVLPVEYVELYGPVKAWMLHFLGFTDIFHTAYFNFLLIWVSVSALVCTFKKIEEAMTAQFDPPVDRPARFYGFGEHRAELEDHGLTTEEIAERVRSAGYRFIEGSEDSEGGERFLVQTGVVKRWGLVVLHVALSAIVIFAVYGAMFSAQEVVPVTEGETESFTVDPFEGKPDWLDSIIRTLGAEQREITLRLHQFDVPLNLLRYPPEWTQEPGVPSDFAYFFSLSERDFRSHVTATGPDEEKDWVVEVNNPLKIAGVDIYQNSFAYEVGFELFGGPGEPRRYSVSMGRRFQIGPNGELQPAASGSNPNALTLPMTFTNVRAGEVHQSGEVVEELPPTAVAEIYEPGTGRTLVRSIVSTDQPLMFTDDVGIRLTENTRPVSVFSYKLNPGIPGIYAASILVIIGTMFSLYFTYFEVYGRRRESTLELRVRRQGLVQDPEDLLDRIREKLQ